MTRHNIAIAIALSACLIIGCSAMYKPLSAQEEKLVMDAIRYQRAADLSDSIVLIEERIAKFQNKKDYSLALKLLIASEDFKKAYEVSDQAVAIYPNYYELLVAKTVLGKLVLAADSATELYKSTMLNLEAVLSGSGERKYNSHAEMILLSKIYDDTTQLERLARIIKGMDYNKDEIEMIQEIVELSKEDVFEVFGIATY
jgi:tetratricopeptide (TPR) repeat protein